VLSSSAFFVFIGLISEDLDVVFQQQSWVIVRVQLIYIDVAFSRTR
jgi:hypothetical protein